MSLKELEMAKDPEQNIEGARWAVTFVKQYLGGNGNCTVRFQCFKNTFDGHVQCLWRCQLSEILSPPYLTPPTPAQEAWVKCRCKRQKDCGSLRLTRASTVKTILFSLKTAESIDFKIVCS
jgi:hypothetical protein